MAEDQEPSFNEDAYRRLLVKALPRPIESDEEHDRQIELVGELMMKDEGEIPPEEGALIQLLAYFIEKYEDKIYGQPDDVDS